MTIHFQSKRCWSYFNFVISFAHVTSPLYMNGSEIPFMFAKHNISDLIYPQGNFVKCPLLDPVLERKLSSRIFTSSKIC